MGSEVSPGKYQQPSLYCREYLPCEQSCLDSLRLIGNVGLPPQPTAVPTPEQTTFSAGAPRRRSFFPKPVREIVDLSPTWAQVTGLSRMRWRIATILPGYSSGRASISASRIGGVHEERLICWRLELRSPPSRLEAGGASPAFSSHQPTGQDRGALTFLKALRSRSEDELRLAGPSPTPKPKLPEARYRMLIR